MSLAGLALHGEALSDEDFIAAAYGGHEIAGRNAVSAAEDRFFAALVRAGTRPARNQVINSRRLPARPHCAFGTTLPDAVFRAERVAVYFDGCYWHECPAHFPGARKGASAARDARATAALQSDGWAVVRGWEHEDVHAIIDRVILTLAYVGERAA